MLHILTDRTGQQCILTDDARLFNDLHAMLPDNKGTPTMVVFCASNTEEVAELRRDEMEKQFLENFVVVPHRTGSYTIAPVLR